MNPDAPSPCTSAAGGPYDVDPVESVEEAFKRIAGNPALQKMFASSLANESIPFNEQETLDFFERHLDRNIELYCQQFH